jgi:hypothetical protein
MRSGWTFMLCAEETVIFHVLNVEYLLRTLSGFKIIPEVDMKTEPLRFRKNRQVKWRRTAKN